MNCLEEYLAGAGDLNGTLRAGAPLHEVAAAAGLIDQSEPMERAHHAPVARVHHPLWGIALACAKPTEVLYKLRFYRASRQKGLFWTTLHRVIP